MRGGARLGAGRPKGSKNKLPRPRILKPEQVLRTRLLQAFDNLDESGELAEMGRRFLDSPDDRVRFAAWCKAVDLLGIKRAEHDDRPDFGEIIAAAARRARAYREEREKGHQPDRPSETADKESNAALGSRPALPPGPAPLVPEVLPPEPALAQEPAVGPDGWPRATLRLVPIVVEPPK